MGCPSGSNGCRRSLLCQTSVLACVGARAAPALQGPKVSQRTMAAGVRRTQASEAGAVMLAVPCSQVYDMGPLQLLSSSMAQMHGPVLASPCALTPDMPKEEVPA